MRHFTLLLLPAAVLAAEQIPLLDKVKGWFSAASALIPTAVPTAISSPLDAGAAKVASLVVHNLNSSNWKDVLEPAGPSITGVGNEWLVYIHGDESCLGGCLNATKAWNVRIISVPLCDRETIEGHFLLRNVDELIRITVAHLQVACSTNNELDFYCHYHLQSKASTSRFHRLR
jgi:hypothetical protein